MLLSSALRERRLGVFGVSGCLVCVHAHLSDVSVGDGLFIAHTSCRTTFHKMPLNTATAAPVQKQKKRKRDEPSEKDKTKNAE
jgi:carbonic anhydrase/acetyltransferase-like protein (isoleucine patch superfamily)